MTARRVALAVIAVATVACQQEGSGTVAKPPEKGGKHECTVTVAARLPPAEPITGSGAAPDEAAATEAAWAQACSKLPPPEQPACHDRNRYQSAVGAARAGDKVSVTVTLTPAPPPQVSGKAASDESEVAACQAALLDACEKAGGEGDCVAAGTHEKKGQVTGSKTSP